MDRHSFGDITVALTGAQKREERSWHQTLTVVQAIINWGGPRPRSFRPKPLDALYRRPDIGSREDRLQRQRLALEYVRERDDKLRQRHADR